MDVYKVVNRERVFMGTLRCEYEEKTLRCTSRGNDSDDWEYTLSGDTLERPQTINGKNSLSQDHDQETTASSC